MSKNWPIAATRSLITNPSLLVRSQWQALLVPEFQSRGHFHEAMLAHHHPADPRWHSFDPFPNLAM
jgi:hypothetical protein